MESLRQSVARLRAEQSQGEPVFLATGRERRVEVGPGVLAVASLDGDAAFAGTVDLEATLAGLASDLRADDAAAVRGRIDALEGGLRQVEASIAEAGARRASLAVARQVAERAAAAVDAAVTKALGADMVQSMSDLAAAEASLRAALEVGTRTLRPMLLDQI